MLIHKSDIEKRLEENPEPIEVTKMREHILSSFANLEFIEEGHIYNLHNADGTVIEKIPSASTIIARYEPESDWDEIALRYALKYDSTKEQVQRMWHENNIKATNNGSSTHLYGENLQRFITNLKEEEICDVIKPQYEDGYLIPYGPKQDAIQKYWQDLFQIKEIYPLLPECKMYMPLGNKFGIKEIFCGTADILLAYKHRGKWSIICHDYKGLPLDTPIATIDGWKNMGDIQKGDVVFDKNGKPTTVLNVSEIHYNPCLKIKFDNNTEIVCDEEHRWEISFLDEEYKDGIKERKFISKIMTAKELFNYMHDHKNYGIRKYEHNIACYFKPKLVPKIFNCLPIDLPTIELTVHPYIVGCWLVNKGQKIRKIDGIKLDTDINGIFDYLNNNFDENIANTYLRSSYKQRLQILQGAMDNNGKYNSLKQEYNIELYDSNKITFFEKLLSTFGINSSINEYILKNKGKAHIKFSTNIYPFKRKKQSILPLITDRHLFRNIKSVEYTDTIPTKCIEVDSPTHTYCCGYDMLVTHNTNKELIKSYNRSNNITMLQPFDNMIDEPMSHYTAQLTLYSMMLENLGYDVIDRRLIWVKDNGEYEKIKLPYIKEQIIQAFDIWNS